MAQVLRKDIGPLLAEKDQSWGIESKPPPAWLGRKDKSLVPWSFAIAFTNQVGAGVGAGGGEDSERLYISYRQ